MAMNALQLMRPRSFVPVEAPKPHLEPDVSDWILVRTRWVSMCGSDIPFFNGSKRPKAYPLLPGAPIHECAGQIVESTSDQFRSGDWVVAIPEGNQGLAEFFLARAARAVRLPAELAACDASCLIQPLATVLNAVDRLGSVAGKSVAVIGLGSIGLLFCWLLKRGGANVVVGIDPIAHRCRMAEEWGATRTFPARGIEAVHDARQNPGAWEAPEICIEAAGHQMDTLNDCFELVRKRGTVVAFGVPDHSVYALEFEVFFRKNAQLIAVVTPEWDEYLAKARDLFLSNRKELSTLVTHRLRMHDAEKAFTLYEHHEDGILKALLDASSWDAHCS
jgi:L-iditol 2-dehydrogenase